MVILQSRMPTIYRRWHLSAWGVSLLAHVGLIWLFSSGEGVSFDSVGDKNASPQVSVVEMLSVAHDTEVKTAKRSGREARIVSAVEKRRLSDQQAVIPVSFPLPSAPYYFSVKELTRKPLIMQDISKDLTLNVPTVPSQAATLRMLINEYGSIDHIVVEDSSLPEIEQEMVIESFSKMRFYPGEINGVPVRSQLRIEVMLNDSEV